MGTSEGLLDRIPNTFAVPWTATRANPSNHSPNGSRVVFLNGFPETLLGYLTTSGINSVDFGVTPYEHFKELAFFIGPWTSK